LQMGSLPSPLPSPSCTAIPHSECLGSKASCCAYSQTLHRRALRKQLSMRERVQYVIRKCGTFHTARGTSTSRGTWYTTENNHVRNRASEVSKNMTSKHDDVKHVKNRVDYLMKASYWNNNTDEALYGTFLLKTEQV